MKAYCVLFNPLAGGGQGEIQGRALSKKMPEDALRFVDITAVKEYAALFASLGPEEGLILCGGDGTLNRFINDTAGLKRPEALFYYACGSGNDFLRDAEKDPSQGPFLLTPYLRSLPQVQVKGAAHFFINGIGYGIDGYCCEKGDELRKKSTRPVNYTAIAINGLLFHYHPTGARVTVDGNTLCFDHVWLAPVMLGRCSGGGMRPTPQQDRFAPEKTLSLMVYHCQGKHRALAAFPSIFKGEHVKYRNMVQILTGRHIRVEFDRPTPLQIDGETILDVTEYEAFFPPAESL